MIELGPMLQSTHLRASAASLPLSILERVNDDAKFPQFKLIRNYRSHPSIVNLLSTYDASDHSSLNTAVAVSALTVNCLFALLPHAWR